MPNKIEKLFHDVSSAIGDFTPDPDDRALDEDSFDLVKHLPEDADLVTLDEYQNIGDVIEESGLFSSTGPIIDDADADLVDGVIRESGLDAIAFYKSIRHLSQEPFPGKWGIFYIEAGVNFLSREIVSYYPGFGIPRKLALEFLRQHERFHFEVDVFSAILERLKNQHLYLPLRYRYKKLPAFCVEEAIANRKTYDWSKRPNVNIDGFAYDFMKCQPGAYSRFDESKLALQAEFAADLLDKISGDDFSYRSVAPFFVSLPQDLTRRSLCPEYVIRTYDRYSWIPSKFGFPTVLEVIDSKTVEKNLRGKYRSLVKTWEDRKKLLMQDPRLKSLHFRPWDKKDKLWSVNVDGNYRAHIQQVSHGHWITQEFGNHKAMGHG